MAVRILAVLLSLLATFQLADAIVRVPSIFSDGCVMQTNAEYGARSFVYGTAVPGETVIVAFTRKGAESNFSAIADARGAWIVTLNPLSEMPFDLRISGTESTNVIHVNGCVGGDVYLCGGQR